MIPLKIRVFLAVAAAKLIRFALRLLRRGGTAMPGRVAVRICPDILGYLAKDVETIVVTGTNGKTTCSRMIEQAYENEKLNYFSIRSGANLLVGITAEFAVRAALTGKPRHKYAVIECDEAACRRTLGLLRPKVLVVTNIFRDQLDRFGAIAETLENIKAGILTTPETLLCLNADCSLTASLAGQVPNECVFFGVDTPIYKQPVDEVSDAAHCIRCKAEYNYEWRTYGHLGGFHCPECGYRRPETLVSISAIQSMDAEGSSVQLRLKDENLPMRVNAPAGYNIYNAAAAVLGLISMGFDPDSAVKAIETFRCGFGRMEKLTVDGTVMRMILVKNPAGCNQVLNFLSTLEEKHVFAACLNDHAGDGTDVSWIWDADFEKLAAMGDTVAEVLVSGERAAEMAMRLKYAGVPAEKLRILPDYNELISAMTAAGLPVFIMPTYSAMLQLREKLSHRSGGTAFWE